MALGYTGNQDLVDHSIHSKWIVSYQQQVLTIFTDNSIQSDYSLYVQKQ